MMSVDMRARMWIDRNGRRGASRFLLMVVLFVLVFAPVQLATGTARESRELKPIKHSVVKSWADKLGVELWHLGDFITRRKEVQDSFKTAVITVRDGSKILETMASDITHMMADKISAVQRIMDAAENTAITHQNDKYNVSVTRYYNAKEMLEPNEPVPPNNTNTELNDRSIKQPYVKPSFIELTEHEHFFNTPVNTSMSAVHVPTNIFDRTEEVMGTIKWTEQLDSIFLDNYNKDPSLSWQFFGSTTGIMRQFPASKWITDPVDLFDCRLRSWYIEAATSPKDMVVLMDVSGSMKGVRKDIARHVVFNILETLGPNDFVNIYKFAEHVEAVVPCFNETLVQATLANKRELQMGLEIFKPNKIANYSAALNKAFDILETYRNEDLGARCNQAIMLVTDGVPYDFTDIFEAYNWQNSSYKPVRIFTYLIGKDVADVSKTKDMACQNQGYYVHLSTLPEVREEVLKYLPVMARPLVLGGSHHPIAWSQVYADVQDPVMTDWMWEVKECQEQKALFLQKQREQMSFDTRESRDRREELRLKRNFKQQFGTYPFNLVTTVSMPVYDRRENANITEDVLINQAYWVKITRETTIANLLGVAGTDIPITEIQKLMMPFMLGVNGYAFIVTNNGYVLTHPDLRPVFQENILKPSYNSIDMIEVELLDDGSAPREFSKMLLEVRESIINQKNGSKYMMTKYHMDQMRRVSRVKRNYYWTALPKSPFTLVITYPEPYGTFRIQHPNDSEMTLLNKKSDLLSFFEGHQWKIHPDWEYCKYSNMSFPSPEVEFLHFLEKFKTTVLWKWKDRSPHLYSNSSGTSRQTMFNKDTLYCNRNLVQGLVYDAKVTEWFTRNGSFNPKDLREFRSRFGIAVTFLSTHSGLTRWKDIRDNVTDDSDPGHDFSKNNKRSVDEIWYKRAVEQHFVEPQSFVFSVPFDVREGEHTLVTASHAIFHADDKKSAPVAVVGYQFQHSALLTLFRNITSICATESCDRPCFSKNQESVDVECFVLDNNGYVVVSQDQTHTGQFFGEVRGRIMERLVVEQIYQEVTITDYQAVCFQQKERTSPGNILQTPLVHVLKFVHWLAGLIAWSAIRLAVLLPVEAMNNFDEYAYDSSTIDPMDTAANDGPASDDKAKFFEESATINRTRLQPCDQEITMYTLYPQNNKPHNAKSVYRLPARDCERPFSVHPIPSSNLILLVYDNLCTRTDPHYKLRIMPKEKEYGDESLACHRSGVNMKRRRPTECISRHANESTIKQCGSGYKNTAGIALLVFVTILVRVL